jgi:hypothetical protein
MTRIQTAQGHAGVCTFEETSMTRHRLLACIGVLGLALAPALPAAAQQRAAGPPQQPEGRGPVSGQSGAAQGEGEPGLAVEQGEMPAFAVTSVEVLQSTQAPKVSLVVVRGVVTSESWGRASLVPLVRGAPSDGVLDLVLVAEPPTETMPAAGFVPVEAYLPVQPDHPYRGVRVRSATNVIAVRQMPGRAEAAGPVEDCRQCVGRSLAGPGAAPGGDAIAPGTLPPGTRVIRPEEGIADLHPDPNRLTLLLGDDGHVTEAVWH